MTLSSTWVRCGLVGLLLGSLPGAATGQDCAPPTEAWGDPWPEQVEVPSMVVGEPGLRLTRDQGERLRCLLQRRLTRPVARLPANLRSQVRDRRVGSLWLDDGRPRIGAFWVQATPDGTIRVSETLSMSRRARIGLVARFERRGPRWRLTRVSTELGHAR